jgi:opacity protein-like surface antigen
MKLFTITTGFISIVIAIVNAADVTYSVIAFPKANENVGVSVGNQDYPLQKSPENANLFTGNAPFGAEYKYTIITSNGNKPENTTRQLAETTTATGNEFFGRSKTLYDIPALPRAYNPIYPRKYLFHK